MVNRRRVFTALIALLVVAGVACADMSLVSQRGAENQRSPCIYSDTNLQYTSLSSSFNCPNAADLGLWSVEFLPKANANVGQTCETQPVQILTDGASSLNLCLYALFGLGLCTYLPRAKNLSLGFIPEWYHDGGPFQIGHSFAISPDSLCSAPVLCFVQPDCIAEDISPEYYKGTIAPLLRKSLFTPNVLDPRGPPFRSC